MLQIAANENAQTAVALSFQEWESSEEVARQKAIARARKYYAGEQTTYLSARLKEILDLDGAVDNDLLFHLNICDKVITAVIDRMSVDGFTSTDESGDEVGATADQSETTSQSDWAWSIWQSNRVDAQQFAIYEGAMRDGEHFVIVDIDNARNIHLTPHQRFVDSNNGGDGYGCKAFYQNDDLAQPMQYAVKRWIERDDKMHPRQRMTLYYPDHLERYVQDKGKWVLTRDNMKLIDAATGAAALIPETVDERGFVRWVDKAGDPLGIPVIHFRNRGLACEVDSTVVSMQNLLNKTLIDLAESSDQAAFRILVSLGFIPTTDGKPLESDGGNRAKVKPNSIVGTNKSPTEASFTAIPPTDPTALITVIEKIMRWVAQAKDIPLSRFQFTEQVAAEGTQKQQEAPLLARIAQLEIGLGDAWEDCFYIARKLANEYAVMGLDETVLIETQWQSPQVRTDDRDNPIPFWTAAAQAVTAGVPIETYLRRNGWTDSDLKDFGTQRMAAIQLQQEDAIPTDTSGEAMMQ